MASSASLSPDTLVDVKIAIDGSNRKFKLPLRDLNALALPSTLRLVLNIPEDKKDFIIERFSDTAATYVKLDAANPSAYKQLFRAAKAKLKLRLRITMKPAEKGQNQEAPQSEVALIGTSITEAPTDAKKPLPVVYQLDPDSASASMPVINSGLGDKWETRPTCWQVFCNSCDKILTDTHFHCSICDNGDYDLCEACVASGKLCGVDNHWLIKRSIKNGKIVSSTTEKVPPVCRAMATRPTERTISSTLSAEDQSHQKLARSVTAAKSPGCVPRRTCNSCVGVMPETSFVHCIKCDDYDLCASCYVGAKHGHHPGHAFRPAVDGIVMSDDAIRHCAAGSNVRHAAICDGCDQSITGWRHKCLDCPDWDLCNKCHATARKDHPGHRFAPLYEPIPPRRPVGLARHVGIYCDGPLCTAKKDQTIIVGVRYKCAICHDMDLCANCEAHPGNKHNPTHPMIKFKTPIRGVSIQTTGDDGVGKALPAMGDRQTEHTTTTTTTTSGTGTAVSSVSSNAVCNAASETLPIYSPNMEQPAPSMPRADRDDVLQAQFVRDLVRDGSNVEVGKSFFQSWTLRNPGPLAWPIGCRLVMTGGDDMACDGTSESQPLLVAVLPGQERSFTVKLQASARPGKHISYWRLKTADGLAFGHKLWCDVNVSKTRLDDAFGESTSRHDQLKCSVAETTSSSTEMRQTEMRQAEAKKYARLQHFQTLEAQRKQVEQSQLAHIQVQKDAQTANSAAGRAWSSSTMTAGNPKQRQMRISELLIKPEDLEKGKSQEISPKTSEGTTIAASPSGAEAPSKQDRNESSISLEMRTNLLAELAEHERQLLLLKQDMKIIPFLMARAKQDAGKEGALSASAEVSPAPAKEVAAFEKRLDNWLKARSPMVVQEGPVKTVEAGTVGENEERYASANASIVSSAKLPKPATVENVDEKMEADELAGSQMVFPRLDKESPANSTHLEDSAMTAPNSVNPVSNFSSAAPSVAAPASTIGTETTAGDLRHEDFEDVETVDLQATDEDDEDDDDDESGFDTDDYDILDASDEDFAGEGRGGV